MTSPLSVLDHAKGDWRAELRRRRAIEEQGAGDAKRPKPLVGVVHLDKCR